MKKAYSYLIGISLNLLIAAFVITLASWNQIYVWLLGDVDMLYKEAIYHYKNRQFEKAFPLFEKLAKIDTASYCKFVLGDMYYRGLAGDVDYKKAFELFEESATLNCNDAHNNLAIMYLYGHGVESSYWKAVYHFRCSAVIF